MKPSLRLLALVALGALLVACAPPRPPSAPLAEPYQADPGGWIWREADGTTAWYLPSSGYVWETPSGVVWAQPRTSSAAPSQPPSVTPFSPGHTGPIFAAVPSTWTWVPPTIDADHGSLAMGSGTVYELHCVLSVISGSGPYYIMAFNSAGTAQPSNGTSPLPGSVSGGMTAVGNDVTFSDQTYPSIFFTLGLLVALSSTADTFTAPAAGNQVRCDAKLRAY